MEKIKTFYKNLGIDFTNLNHPISKMINSVALKSQTEQENLKHYLRVLALSLVDIKEHDKKIYKKYANKIKTANNNNIYGHIFEIVQCSHFIDVCKKENLIFKFGNANDGQPDFLIDNLGFEITSSRFSDDSPKFDPGNKLLQSFRKKNKKSYISSSTALLIDITNISQKAFGKEVSMSLNQFCEIVKLESKFGVVLLFTEWVDENTGNTALITSGIIFSEDCNEQLKSIIENIFFQVNNIEQNKNYLSKNK